MKTNVFTTLLILLASCQPAEKETDLIAPISYPVQFTLRLKEEILPFPGSKSSLQTKSMPDLSLPEPITKTDEPGTGEGGNTENPGGENNPAPSVPGEEKDLSDLCTQIEYVIYAADHPDECLKHRHFTLAAGDIDFGIVYDTLPAGNYQIAFVSHSSETARLTSQRMSFEPLTDTFYASADLTVRGGESLNQDFTLARLVGKIEFVSTDPIPSALQRFTIAIDRYPCILNLLTGEGIAADQPVSLKYTFTADDVNQTGRQHAFYTFIPSGDGTLDLRLTATDADGQSTRERVLTGIRPEANRILRYTGRLYTFSDIDNTFNLSIYNNGKWDQTQEVELPD